MKEYLIKCYLLGKAEENDWFFYEGELKKDDKDIIEIPDGAESAYFYSGSKSIEFYKKDLYFDRYYLKWFYCDTSTITGDLVWQRDKVEVEDSVSISKVDETLKERQSQYGDFTSVANTTGQLMAVILNSRNGKTLPYAHEEALHMICSKIARIMNGDMNHKDSWHDIGGYAKLIEDSIEE